MQGIGNGNMRADWADRSPGPAWFLSIGMLNVSSNFSCATIASVEVRAKLSRALKPWAVTDSSRLAITTDHSSRTYRGFGI